METWLDQFRTSGPEGHMSQTAVECVTIRMLTGTLQQPEMFAENDLVPQNITLFVSKGFFTGKGTYQDKIGNIRKIENFKFQIGENMFALQVRGSELSIVYQSETTVYGQQEGSNEHERKYRKKY